MRIFYDYGEEKWSKRIAEFICEKRKKIQREREEICYNFE